MKQIKWIFLFLAIAAASCMIGIGIAIGERSFAGVFASIVGLILVMGIGFKIKRRMREEGKL